MRTMKRTMRKTRRRMGMARRGAQTRARIERTRRRMTRKRTWKRRGKTIRPKKEALSLMRWDESFLYLSLVPFFTMKRMMFIGKSFSALSLRP